MKARLPKSFNQLPPSEKDKINEIMTQEVIKQVVQEQAELQKIWLKMACIVLHKNFGFGKKRCMLFLGTWREMYRINSKIEGAKEQAEYLATELAKIFRKDDYPQEYIDKLEKI